MCMELVPKIIYPGENMPIAPKLGPNSITEGLQLAVSCHILEPCGSFLPDCKENLSVDSADSLVSIDLKCLKSLLLLDRMKPKPSFFNDATIKYLSSRCIKERTCQDSGFTQLCLTKTNFLAVK